DIGNWLLARQGGDQNGASLRQTTYMPDDLNRYPSRSMTATDQKADIIGLGLVQTGTPSTVLISGVAPDYRRGGSFWQPVADGSGPNWLSVSVTDGSATVG